MGWLRGIIARKLPDAALVVSAALARKEPKGAMARTLELTMRHCSDAKVHEACFLLILAFLSESRPNAWP